MAAMTVPALELLLVLMYFAEDPSRPRDARELLSRLRAYPPSRHPALWGPSREQAPAWVLELEARLGELRGASRNAV